MDMYVPASLAVIYANELPKDAIGRVEAVYRRPRKTESEDRDADE